MAQSNRTVKTTTEVVEIEPARPAVTKTVTTTVPTIHLALTPDEADSLATLLHCNVGGLQRSPALSAVLRALEGTEGVNPRSRDLIRPDLYGNDGKGFGTLVLADLFGMDNPPVPVLMVGDRVKRVGWHRFATSHKVGDTFTGECERGDTGTVVVLHREDGRTPARPGDRDVSVKWDTRGNTSVIAASSLKRL